MMLTQAERDKLNESKRIAKAGGCFVVSIPFYDKQGNPATKYLLYRESDPRNLLVGKRMNVGSLLRLVKDATATEKS